MPIYADPDELLTDPDGLPTRRLSNTFRASLTPLPGLEAATGADFLITPLSLPLTDVSNLDSAPIKLALEAHCNAGMLVQRKSGGDFLSSIPRLSWIQTRMLQWTRCGSCWLVATSIDIADDGTVKAGGRRTSWTYESMKGACGWWQLRGGHVEFLPDDNALGSWFNEKLEQAKIVRDEPVKYVCHNEPYQVLRFEVRNWVTTGRMFPDGVGRKKREAVMDSLIEDGLDWTAMNALFRIAGGLVKVKGFGKVLTEECRRWCGYVEE